MERPSWQPPGSVFGPVWTVLYVLATIVGLIRLVWPHNRAAAGLLVPYGLWVSFATALTWTIAASN